MQTNIKSRVKQFFKFLFAKYLGYLIELQPGDILIMPMDKFIDGDIHNVIKSHFKLKNIIYLEGQDFKVLRKKEKRK